MKKLITLALILASSLSYAKNSQFSCIEPINDELFGVMIDIENQRCLGIWIDGGVRIDSPDNKCDMLVERTTNKMLIVLGNYVGLRKSLTIDLTNQTVQVGQAEPKKLNCVQDF